MKGIKHYATLLSLLHAEPRPVKQLAIDIGFPTSLCMVSNTLRLMHHFRLIHVSGIKRTPPRGKAVIWGAGPGVDAAPLRAKTVKPTPEMVAFVEVIKALREPVSLVELAEQSGMNEQTVGRLLRHMKGLGLIYVAEWWRQDKGGSPRASYMYGIGVADKPRPKPEKRSDIWRRSDEKRRMRRSTAAMCQVMAGPLNQRAAS